MSGSDENTGPGVQLKDALPLVPGAPSLSPCTALKPSNKANIMSPVNCGKVSCEFNLKGLFHPDQTNETMESEIVLYTCVLLKIFHHLLISKLCVETCICFCFKYIVLFLKYFLMS